MASQLYNNVSDALLNSIDNTQTSFDLVSGNIPSVDPGDYIPIYVLRSSDGAFEIMHVTGVSGSTVTVTRAAEDTNPLTFPSGDSVQIRPTRQSLRDMETSASEVTTATGTQLTDDALGERGIWVTDLSGLKSLDISLTPNGASARITTTGRSGEFTWDSSDLSSEVSSDTQEGIYVAPLSDVTGASGAWVRQYNGYADVSWFGASLDNVTDDTAAFNGALTMADRVWFEGDAYITDMITVRNHKQFVGTSIADSRLQIKSDFNLAAEAVVKMGTSENTGIIDKIGIAFEQPDSTVRADMIQYPPAVGHADIPRVRIGHIRITRGWDGIDASGNAGGATYDWIECGCLNVGLRIDGALDTMNIGRFRFWPFGMSSPTGVGAVYRDGQTYAAVIGRCDGLAGELHSFRGKLFFNSNGGSSADRHLSSVHLDGDGADLICNAGPVDISYLYSTKSSSQTAEAFLIQSSATVRIGSIKVESDLNGIPIRVVGPGSLTINGGRINHIRTATRAVYVDGTSPVFSARNTELTAPGSRTEPYIRADTGQMVTQNCYFPDNGGSGVGIRSLSGNELFDNGVVLNGRTISDDV